MYLLADPAPGTDQGVTNSTEIMQRAVKSSEMFINSFSKDWDSIASGTSPVYTAVVSVSMLIAVVLVSIWSLQWYQMFAEEGFSSGVLSEMAMPLLVILLLTNNGYLLAQGTLALKNTTTTLNSQVLRITRNGVTLKDAIRAMNFDQSFTFAIQAAVQSCDKLDDKDVDTDGTEYSPRQDCINRTVKTAQEEAVKIREERGIQSGKKIKSTKDFFGEIINSAIQTTLFVIFNGLAAAFQYIVQLSLLLVAYIAPIFLVLSLLPVSAKAIYAWLSGWLGISLVLISYSIIVGISASSIVNADTTDPILSQIIIGVLSPILAVAIGTGTAMATFTSVSGGIKAVAGIRR